MVLEIWNFQFIFNSYERFLWIFWYSILEINLTTYFSTSKSYFLPGFNKYVWIKIHSLQGRRRCFHFSFSTIHFQKSIRNTVIPAVLVCMLISPLHGAAVVAFFYNEKIIHCVHLNTAYAFQLKYRLIQN